ncbi:MAG: pectic acid lyase [Planctomycetes bacterium]|nr:pectic acid lyase [Planctomycetota bacterium]MBL7038755.1 pectic acid lyase [Pirellulaceae bacterium]
MSLTTTKVVACWLLTVGLLAPGADGLPVAVVAGSEESDRSAVDGFRPQTRREAELYQILLQLEREVAQLRQEIRAEAAARDGRGTRGGHRAKYEGDRILPSALATDPLLAQQVDSDLRQAAMRAMKKAAAFYHDEVASHRGYVYYYSLDLQQRWGEGKASFDTIFVQPPGTPAVGMAYLEAYAATGDSFYLDAGREAAEALVAGQLESGGWTQVIHFGPAKRLGKYRKRRGGSWDFSSLDDGQTQAALQMLVRADRALDFEHADIHEAAQYGLDALLGSQFPNGAFPQGWRGPVEPKPVLEARYPDYDWRTEGRVKNYWDYYTLNDNVAGTVADALIDAHRVYKDEKHKAALERLGAFLILAQMPDPQPGWCQQYNYETVPMWARKFEPPAITGWESQDVMETLIKIARYTGNEKYLEPIPRALEYFKKCLLPDGTIARYYELKTNRPLYMDARYQLTYDDSAVPGHYGWKQPARFDSIVRAYLVAKSGADPAPAPAAKELEDNVRAIIRGLDAGGRWITTYAGERLVGQPDFSESFRYISSAVFSRNVEILSEYIALSGK